VDITTEKVRAYVKKRQEAGYSNAEINRELAALKRMFNLASQQTPPKVNHRPYIPMLQEDNVRTGFFEAEAFRTALKERLPALVAAYARKTRQLVTALRAIGGALGGNAGARLAARLRLPTSPAPVLRLVRTAPVPPTPALQAVGVDARAGRQGHRYGTMLVPLADHRVVDLLPDRSAATVAAWLAQHPTITVVGRDRSDLEADGMRRGVLEAVQGVDRFPLVHNLRQALEAVLLAHRPALQAAAVGTAMARTPATGVVPVIPRYQGRRRPSDRPGTPGGSPSMRPGVRCGRGGRPSLLWPGRWASAARPSMPTSGATRRPARDSGSGRHPLGS
jgi:hypothetical protein